MLMKSINFAIYGVSGDRGGQTNKIYIAVLQFWLLEGASNYSEVDSNVYPALEPGEREKSQRIAMIGYLHKTWNTTFANMLNLSEDIGDLKNLAGQNNIRLPSSCDLIKTLLKHSVHMSIFHVFKDITKQVEPVPCPCWPGCRIAHLWLSPTPASPSTAPPPPRQQAGKFASKDTIEDIRYWI